MIFLLIVIILISSLVKKYKNDDFCFISHNFGNSLRKICSCGKCETCLENK
ncbi:hypothetical protein [Clostridium sp.]|uniref:hypothetical protein n=1 Tax=Clostridium sp. TaxID=1506 RepID=UPI003463AE61